MTEIKEQILLSIYKCFEDWSHGQSTACREGCAVCCTQSVTVTATEASLILNHIVQENQHQWLVQLLEADRKSDKPAMTTNQFANACLAGQEVDPGDADNFSPCLFLKQGRCQVYQVRPFSCRAFISTTTCSKNNPASVSEDYLAAAAAVHQIIEHLGQKEYWGLLFDVLTVLCEQKEHQKQFSGFEQSRILNSRLKLLKAEPLQGFLLTEQNHNFVEPLLSSIFSTKIDHRTIEEILNGKV